MFAGFYGHTANRRPAAYLFNVLRLVAVVCALGVMLVPAPSEAGKRASRPWLGVSMSQPRDGGVQVEVVFKKSPAAAAKLQKGDRITHADGVKLEEPADLVRHVARHKPGMTIKLAVRRGGKGSTKVVTLAEHPGRDQILRLMHVGEDAYELSGLTPVQGSTPASIKDLRGRVVLLDFFASWCGNCKRMTPELARLEMKFGGRGLTLLSITSDDEPRAREVIKSWKIPYAVASNERKETFSAYSVSSIPAVYIVDKKGKIREVLIGNDPSRRKATEELIEKLLSEK